MKAFITGTGVCLPDRTVSNEELESSLGLSPAQIFASSGIRERRWANPGTKTSSLAVTALQGAITDADISKCDIDYLLFGTMTPDRFIPGSSYAVQKQLSLREIPCLDLRAGCCNTLYALQIAKGLLATGVAATVAVCLADIQSPWLDLSPESGKISMLFGDGASALIVSTMHSRLAIEVEDIILASDGSYIDELGIRLPGTEFGITGVSDEPDRSAVTPHMNGQSVIIQAAKRVPKACNDLLIRNGLTINDIRWIVPHQANTNLISQIARSLEFEKDEGLITVLETFGNTSSASMGMALHSLRISERLSPGDVILLPAFGTGFTWGAGLARVVGEVRTEVPTRLI